ncbi:MAG: hypothetical protein Ct9H300mP11_32310 [Chloroflexota bacterium]|nr:MAG: hypothetical protein Ct9H300mP11_32310 [Chloroflexota bacterium]
MRTIDIHAHITPAGLLRPAKKGGNLARDACRCDGYSPE